SEKEDLQQQISQLNAELDQFKQEQQNQQADHDSSLANLQAELELEKERTDAITGSLQEAKTSRDSLSQQLDALEQEKQQLQQQLDESKAEQATLSDQLGRANESLAAAASDDDLKKAQQALSESEETIIRLKREVEGLREVQLEMESQLTDDVESEVSALRAALETEQKKREKNDKLARQADVLRRERDVQETAIEMLGEDLENLTEEKDRLQQERDNLTKQLAEMRNQFTDMVNENDHLNSEMSELRDHVSDSNLADDLLVQMEELRIKAENLETERDEANDEATRMRREVGELRSVIETYVEQIQDVQSFGVDEQVNALRTELDMVRRQAAEDLEHMRHELEHAKSKQSLSSNRDVDEVAALQASRQEMLSLQQSLNEKDHLLRLSQSQCRSLEDSVEDRDKEVDQLKRKLELLLRKTGGLDTATSPARETPEAASRLSELGEDGDPKRNSLGRLFRRK
ncbi:MAG: hypothetical protein AB2720_10720, partial [Candidatus Thiodiazotropha taylori]